jgi:hypothetical protein
MSLLIVDNRCEPDHEENRRRKRFETYKISYQGNGRADRHRSGHYVCLLGLPEILNVVLAISGRKKCPEACL